MPLLACIAERRSEARSQAAAPLLLCLLPPVFWGSKSLSTKSEPRRPRKAGPQRLASPGKPLGNASDLARLSNEATGVRRSFTKPDSIPMKQELIHCVQAFNTSPPSFLRLCHGFSSKTETTTGGHAEHPRADNSAHRRPSTSSPPPHPSEGRGRQMSPRGVWKVSPGSRINQVPAHTARAIIYG